jgi:hypothetical protein
MEFMRTLRLALAGALLLCLVNVASAHHSAAAQDFGRRVDVQGVIKVWEIANPHGRVVLTITDTKGSREVEFETHSRNNVYRAGYRDGMLKAGEKITLTIAPNRDGSEGGYVVAFTTAKGEKIGLQ